MSLSISRGWEVQVPTFRARKATHHTHSEGGWGGVNLLLINAYPEFVSTLLTTVCESRRSASVTIWLGYLISFPHPQTITSFK